MSGNNSYLEVCYHNETISILETNTPCDICLISAIIHLIFPIIMIISWKIMKIIQTRANNIKVGSVSKTKTDLFGNKIAQESRMNSSSSNSSVVIKKFSSKSCFARFQSPAKTAEALDSDDLKRIVFESRKDEQESPFDYRPGGYMPLTPGTFLDNRCRVLRKLGFGHFSTVWLCESLNSKKEDKHMAVKVCKSDSAFNDVAKDEIRLLSHAKRCDPTDPGHKRIVLMIETFTMASSNGIHSCIAFELMGPSLFNLLQYSQFKGVDIETVKRIIRQLCQGLNYLHEKCRIIHTDLKPENILIKVNQQYIDELVAKAKKFEHVECGMPKSYITTKEWQLAFSDLDQCDIDDGGLEENSESSVGKQSVSCPSEREADKRRRGSSAPSINGPIFINPNIEIKIADLGNACWEREHFSSEIQTREYRALEVIMGANYSFSADMWSVGCTAYEMATGELLFSPKGKSRASQDIDHLCLIWETLGGIPRYITETGGRAATYFENGQLRDVRSDDIKVWKVEDVLVDKYNWKRVAAIPLAGLIEGLIEPDPALRLTASAALKTPFLVKEDYGDY